MKKRSEEIVILFSQIVQNNLNDLISGKADDYLDIHTIAGMMNINATYLSNVVKETSGKSPCDICNEHTLAVAEKMMTEGISVAQVARQLTFEPTNFTKYFKKHRGMTPSAFRESVQLQNT